MSSNGGYGGENCLDNDVKKACVELAHSRFCWQGCGGYAPQERDYSHSGACHGLNKRRGINCYGQWKCNIFVYEILGAAGANAPLIGGMLRLVTVGRYGYPPSASDWADGDTKINEWTITTNPTPGDVVSTGEHVGIYIGNGKMISAGRDKIVMTPLKSYENYTYRHYEGTLMDSISTDIINSNNSNN